jgi:hypothetical protein
MALTGQVLVEQGNLWGIVEYLNAVHYIGFSAYVPNMLGVITIAIP